MKYLFIIFITLILFAGCKGPQIVTVTELRDTTIFVEKPFPVDKLIYVPLPKDSAKISDAVIAVPDSIKHIPFRSLYKENGIISLEISGRWINMDAKAYLNDSTLSYRYRDTLTYQDSITIHNAISKTEVKITLPPEKYVPRFYKNLLWFNILCLVAIAGLIAYRLKGAAIRELLSKLK